MVGDELRGGCVRWVDVFRGRPARLPRGRPPDGALAFV